MKHKEHTSGTTMLQQQQQVPFRKDLVLVGGGHAHVHVIKMIGMVPLRHQLQQSGIAVTLITQDVVTPYSGMLPGYVAGHYTYDDIHIDLHRLCRFANVRLIHATVIGMTYNKSNNSNDHGGACGGILYCQDGMTTSARTAIPRPPIRYDCVSFDIGSAPAQDDNVLDRYRVAAAAVHCTARVIPVKPIAQFGHFVQQLQMEWRMKQQQHQQPQQQTKKYENGDNSCSNDIYTLGVVGGGAGGVELALALHHFLETTTTTTPAPNSNKQRADRGQTTAIATNNNNNTKRFQVVLVTRGTSILESYNATVQDMIKRILEQRGIVVHYQSNVVRIEPVVITNTNPQTVSMTVSSTMSVDDSDHKPSSSTQLQLILSTQQQDETPDPIILHDCLWCVQAGVSSWLRTSTPLTTTPTGFIRVNDTYQAIHHPGVFAAGDCCHMDPYPRPKAGVYAVRAGPYLLENLVRYCTGRNCHLRRHIPQQHFLSLLSTGPKYAVANKGSWLALQGAWVWTLKDYIDRKFINKFGKDLPNLEEMMQQQQQHQSTSWWWWWGSFSIWFFAKSSRLQPHDDGRFLPSLDERIARQGTTTEMMMMRCGGCGAKVGSNIVSRVLRQIQKRQESQATAAAAGAAASGDSTSDTPVIPIDHDDVAVIQLASIIPEGDLIYKGALIQTMDYFREIVPDPYIFGKIIAVHSLSDVYAMGGAAKAQTALSLAVVRYSVVEAITENTLLQLMAGVSDVLQHAGVRLVGGHTCEGPELACGLSIQGYVSDACHLLRKRGGQIGDCLVLTKPLGTGALFAADMRAKIRGCYVLDALRSMIGHDHGNNDVASDISLQFAGSIHACTDITGFGLVGHLLEMLMANERNDHGLETIESIAAILRLTDIPFYQGGIEASKQGIYSSLQSENWHHRHAVVNHTQALKAYPIEYPLLFDPQTAGGLLFFVAPDQCDAFVTALRTRQVHAITIGQIEPFLASNEDITIPSSNDDLTASEQDGICSVIGCNNDMMTRRRIRIVL